MEPQIQYVKTSDGVTIAYFVIGSGAPLVLMDLPVSNLLAEWRHPGFRESYQTIARTYTVVRYNPRGFGLSERECHDFSLPAMIRDLEAVVDRLELPPFGVIAQRAITSPLAFAYAAAYPDRLTHLAVIGAVLRVPELFMRQVNSVMQVPGADWEFVSENIERFSRGWDDNESSAELAALLRESIDYHAFHEFWRDLSTWDASECLPRITTPTLLIHRQGHPSFGPEHARMIAPQLQDVRSIIIDGKTVNERAVQSAAAIAQFIGAPAPRPQAAPAPALPPSGTAIILFADIVDSTALTERLGDTAFRDKARGLDEAMRAAIRANGGTPVEGKTLGDGVLAVFTSAKQSIACAQACHEAAGSAGLSLHLGIHAGDVIREAANVYGGAVNIAARVAAASAAGETLVSGTVRDLARTSAGVTFEDRGEHALKGIDEPVRVWAVREEQ